MSKTQNVTLDKKTQEEIKNLRIIDDALFRLMAARKGVCQEILRTLLDDDELEVVEVTPQNEMISLFRGVILDALCRLSNGEYCNIEMQKDDRANDVKRTRYHASLVTVNKTPKGTDFGLIPSVKILYITTYDALGNGQTLTYVSRCQKVKDEYLPLNDGEDIIYANTKIDDSTKHSRLLKLFLKSDCFYDEMFPALSEAMQFYKGTERGQETVSEVTKKWKQEGYEAGLAEGTKQGIKQGIEQGIEQGKRQMVVSMINNGKLTVTQGAEELGISEEELQRIVTGADPVTKEEQ